MRSHDWLKMALSNWAYWVEFEYSGIIPRKNIRGTLGRFAKPTPRQTPEENKQAVAINQAYWLLMADDAHSALIINYKYNRGFGNAGLAKIMGYSVSTVKRRIADAEMGIKQFYYSIEQ